MKKRLYLGILVVMLLAVSCTKDVTYSDTRVPIVFRKSVVHSTKGAAVTTTGGMTEFGLYAAYTQSGSLDASTTVFNNMLNARYYFYSGYWIGETDNYWPNTGKLSFVAYTPYERGSGMIDGFVLPKGTAPGYPRFTYTPATSGAGLTAMPDICLSSPLVNCVKPVDGDIAEPLEFHHILTGISFKGRYDVSYPAGNFSTDYSVKLISLELGGIIGTKYVQSSGSAPYFVWQSDGSLPKTTTYTLTVQDGQLETNGFNIFDSRQPFNTADGMLYLIPQTPSNATVTVTYGVYLKSNDALLATFTSDPLALPDNAWEPGDIIDYVLGPVMMLNDDTVVEADGCETAAPAFHNWIQQGRPED